MAQASLAASAASLAASALAALAPAPASAPAASWSGSPGAASCSRCCWGGASGRAPVRALSLSGVGSPPPGGPVMAAWALLVGRQGLASSSSQSSSTSPRSQLLFTSVSVLGKGFLNTSRQVGHVFFL